MLELCPVWLLCGRPSGTEFREFVRIWPKHADGWGLGVQRCREKCSQRFRGKATPASCDILRVHGGTAEGGSFWRCWQCTFWSRRVLSKLSQFGYVQFATWLCNRYCLRFLLFCPEARVPHTPTQIKLPLHYVFIAQGCHLQRRPQKEDDSHEVSSATSSLAGDLVQSIASTHHAIIGRPTTTNNR